MPPTIHLVRHAQGLHNFTRENEALPSPNLTSLGEQQYAALNLSFPYHNELRRFYAFPLRRTITTCHLPTT